MENKNISINEFKHQQAQAREKLEIKLSKKYGNSFEGVQQQCKEMNVFLQQQAQELQDFKNQKEQENDELNDETVIRTVKTVGYFDINDFQHQQAQELDELHNILNKKYGTTLEETEKKCEVINSFLKQQAQALQNFKEQKEQENDELNNETVIRTAKMVAAPIDIDKSKHQQVQEWDKLPDKWKKYGMTKDTENKCEVDIKFANHQAPVLQNLKEQKENDNKDVPVLTNEPDNTEFVE